VTASEFVFLALGLGLGIVTGIALVEVLRARPPVPREVRLIVEPDAIPRRRPSTLSHDGLDRPGPETARGGPADRRAEDRPVTTTAPPHRTVVRSGPGVPVGPGAPEVVAIPVTGGDDPVLAALRIGLVSSAMRDGHGIIGSPDLPGSDPELGALRVGTAVATLERPVASATDGSGPASTSGPTGGHDPGGAQVTTEAGGGSGTTIEPVLDPSDPCAAERRIAAERCGLAVRARAGANDDAAAAIADARTVRRDKEAAQAHFRSAYNSAKSAEEAEAAARDWLTEINDINSTARAAAATAKRERAAATALSAQLERMSLEADAARIAAETAEAACLAARVSLAECDERTIAGEVKPLPAAPWVEPPHPVEEDDMPLAAAPSAGGTPTIFRLVRGDRRALIALVERLAGEDPVARRRWQLTLSNLVDAIVAVSIEAGALEFPADHPFWGTFTLVQDREIAQALASLGYRFDGLGGFADERVPSQRDMSLALGYAGLDPMRMRTWPTEAEMRELYRDVTVAADEHLAATAGDLSLSELVALLGRRADGLADLWNEWGRVRPLLLDGA